MVAPHAGARIEILTGTEDSYSIQVAPHAGARIEIGIDVTVSGGDAGRSPRGSAD